MTSADRPASPSRPDGLWPGCHHPLGATVCADGINFAVFSEHATRIEIAIHDPQSGEETARLEL
ncbi:MAG: hypothetical protein KDH19_12620, partial [Geminicoccaceae bacterium]|nr:hypothetical protein [Geminicoccaceae bacterium]